jgi:hypothetical protein
MTPRPQLAAAARATQLTDAKERVDLERVRTYHQHRVPPSTKRRPSLPAKEWGGPPRFNEVVTLSSPTKRATRRAAHHTVVTTDDAGPPTRRQSGCRSTVCGHGQQPRPTSRERCVRWLMARDVLVGGQQPQPRFLGPAHRREPCCGSGGLRAVVEALVVVEVNIRGRVTFLALLGCPVVLVDAVDRPGE